MYQEYLAATKDIQAMIGEKRFMFVRPFNRKALIASAKLFAPPKDYTKDTARTIIEEIIDRLKPFSQVLQEKTIETKVTIEEKIFAITEGLIKRAKVAFSDILKTSNDKTEVVVAFLAMLELVRMRQIGVSQDELFSEIEMFKLAEDIKGL
jgi:segregation and condensation protein A